MDNRFLPEFVAEWLPSSVSLSQLVRPAALQCDRVLIEHVGDHVKWTDPESKQVWTCHCSYEKCAIIFCARSGTDEETELFFDGETWVWAVCCGGGDPQERYRMPAAVAKSLTQLGKESVINPILFKAF